MALCLRTAPTSVHVGCGLALNRMMDTHRLKSMIVKSWFIISFLVPLLKGINGITFAE